MSGGAKSLIKSSRTPHLYRETNVSLRLGDALNFYAKWPPPTTIVSDGAYGVLGFEGDTSDHLDIPIWYEPHAKAWASASQNNTTLWFWNSEVGWAAAHPVLEKYGFKYINCNIWNKGVGHIAGNVNTKKIRRFPVVTEVCVQYVRAATVNQQPLKQWLLREWKRTGMAIRRANEACDVKDAAARKYFDQGRDWYCPPVDMMQRMIECANTYGHPEGRPYFSFDGHVPVKKSQWAEMQPKFNCPHGVTNVWDRKPVRGTERIRDRSARAIHPNQKPLDLMERIVRASTTEGDVVWEPFGGLFTASLAARNLQRKAFAAEINASYFRHGMHRFLAQRP